MSRNPFPPSRRRMVSVPRRRAFRPTLEIFEPRRLLSVNVLTYHNDARSPDSTLTRRYSPLPM